MEPLYVINRKTGKKEREKIFGEGALRFFYSEGTLASILRNFISKFPLVSSLFGWWQSLSFTKKNVGPFIKEYGVDSTEFEKQDFDSFNDFFIRKLKIESRPIAKSPAIIPADGRYRFFQTISDPLFVKGAPFDLEKLLQDKTLAEQFSGGNALLARLCPTDCHRFVFPVDCIPSGAKLIGGPLYSVNPIALQKNWRYLTENKRYITLLQTESFGRVAMLEVGATNVGSVHQTYTPGNKVLKGEEKGYFSFGGSAIILLFEKNSIQFSQDLINLSKENLEINCLIGQELGLITIK